MARRRTTESSAGARAAGALAYENRKGVTYYLHERRTAAGKVRYVFSRSVGEGALTELPAGYEVVESVNAVVSVRRRERGEAAVADEDLALVRAEMQRHGHLAHHVAAVERGAIVIHEPGISAEELRHSARYLGTASWRVEAFVADSIRAGRFTPVLRFVPDGAGWVAHRMTYRGHGGWSHPLAVGDLATLVQRLVRHVGRETFFELM